jgi:hypothetical protein
VRGSVSEYDELEGLTLALPPDSATPITENPLLPNPSDSPYHHLSTGRTIYQGNERGAEPSAGLRHGLARAEAKVVELEGKHDRQHNDESAEYRVEDEVVCCKTRLPQGSL